MVEKHASETSLILNLFLFLSILPEYRAVSNWPPCAGHAQEMTHDLIDALEVSSPAFCFAIFAGWMPATLCYAFDFIHSCWVTGSLENLHFIPFERRTGSIKRLSQLPLAIFFALHTLTSSSVPLYSLSAHLY